MRENPQARLVGVSPSIRSTSNAAPLRPAKWPRLTGPTTTSRTPSAATARRVRRSRVLDEQSTDHELDRALRELGEGRARSHSRSRRSAADAGRGRARKRTSVWIWWQPRSDARRRRMPMRRRSRRALACRDSGYERKQHGRECHGSRRIYDKTDSYVPSCALA